MNPMNCSEFQDIVRELARDARSHPADGPVEVDRERGLAHARVCARCDAMLIEAGSLSASLRALASSDARAEAPPRVEAAVLAAYRQRRLPAPKPLPEALPDRARWRVPAAVTGLAIAAGLAITISLYRPAGHPTHSQTALGRAMVRATIASPAAGSANHNPDNPVQHIVAQSGTARGGIARVESAQVPRAPSNRQRASMASATLPHSSEDADSLEDISATRGAFMPLPYADSGPVEDATVIRMALPGTALSALGLPVTDGGADGRVVADFIVGEDGMPEAIRIVR
jgi:hypothetical protein